MKLHFLGTCAGTEPMPDRKHMSFALESNGWLYWFDAGEGCSYTAHNMGLDLQTINKIIISHTHMDHVGGLGNLLWNIRKLYFVRKQLPKTCDIDVYIPNMKTWEGLWMILANTEGNFEAPFRFHPHQVQDGVLFDDGNVKVTAFHNKHLPATDGLWRAFSYLIECEGKRLVFSGDVHKYSELDPLVGTGCDGLIIETGHFDVEDVYAFAKDKSIGRLYFSHNGREILHSPHVAAEKIKNFWGDRAVVCYDTMTEEL